MQQSLTLERPDFYAELRDDAFAYSLRLPPSWRETRHFTGGGKAVLQFTSPPLGQDKSRETVHASLSLTVEPAPEDGSLESYYQQSRVNLGDSFQILDHKEWRGRLPRRAAHGDSARDVPAEAVLQGGLGPRATRLTLEARDDVFPRVGRWYDLIAGTFRVGSEMKTP